MPFTSFAGPDAPAVFNVVSNYLVNETEFDIVVNSNSHEIFRSRALHVGS